MPEIKFDTEVFAQLPKGGTPDCYATSKELPKERKEKPHIGFLLDESSSMTRVWQDTISGFNYYITQLRDELPGAKITFATFVNYEFKLRGEDKPIDEVLPLNTLSYTPYGGTPLVDSIMQIITIIQQRINVDQDIKPTVVIQTDGEENASKKYTMFDLAKRVKEKRKDGWKFILLTCGYNPNKLANKMGVDPEAAIEYGPGKTREAFKLTAKMTTQVAKTGEEVVFSLEDKRSLR